MPVPVPVPMPMPMPMPGGSWNPSGKFNHSPSLRLQGELTAKYGPQRFVNGAVEEAEAVVAATPAVQQEQQPAEVVATGGSGSDVEGETGQQHRPKRAASARAPRVATKSAGAAAVGPQGKQQRQQLEKAAKKDLQDLIKSSRRLFALLPLGALVGQHTLVLHGGLFRAPPAAGLKGKQRRNVKAGE